MQEIKCPKCGEVFQVDELGYAAIVKQVRDKEFSKEIESREAQFESDKNNAIQLAKLEIEKNYNEEISKKDFQIAKLESDITMQRAEQQVAINEAL